MEKWLYMVYSDLLDPETEGEYREWYEKTHYPDILETEGMVRIAFHKAKNPAEGQGRFLTVIEIETDDIDNTMVVHQKNMEKKGEQGRISGLGKAVSRHLYQQQIEVKQ